MPSARGNLAKCFWWLLFYVTQSIKIRSIISYFPARNGVTPKGGFEVQSIRSIIDEPPRYQAETAWGPVGALLMTLVIVLAPMLLVALWLYLPLALAAGGGPAPAVPINEVLTLSRPEGVILMGGGQLLSVLLVLWAAGRGGLRWPTLSLVQANPGYLTCIKVGLVFILAISVIELLLYYFIDFDVFKDSKFLVEGLRSVLWPATVIIAVILAPLWEELTFRGFLLSALAKTRLGIVGGGLVSTGLWTALHSTYSIPALISVFVAGLALTWLVWKTGSIRIAIVIHAMINASAAIFAGVFSPF